MTNGRIVNFSAGPSMLPESVLRKAAEQMLNYEGSGMSVMEMSHRSPVYDAIIVETQRLLREVMSIPDNYKVLFMQGGGTMQFSAVPMNLMKNGVADYALTGNFSENAYKEAKKFGTINVACSTKEENYARIPSQDEIKISDNADYFYICDNNTIYGTEWKYVPETGNTPLVSDMSSNILSKPIDVSKYGVIYAGAQKNMGPAGVTVVIVREDLLGNYKENSPVLLDYKLMADKDSMYNTPATYGIYILKLVLEWIRDEIGGVEKMQVINERKAAILYDYLKTSKMFKGTAVDGSGSTMNVTFRTGDDELDAKFIKAAKEAGMTNLKGHRVVGGMRASMYNAMPEAGVQKLVDFMAAFEKENA